MIEDTKQERLDITKFNVPIENNPNLFTRIAIVGLGATGSAFMMMLGHHLKYQYNVTVDLFDFDNVEEHNNRVSLYSFANIFGVRSIGVNKASLSRSMLNSMINSSIREKNRIYTFRWDRKIDYNQLNEFYNNENINLNTIFVFTDNNESRYEIAKYHKENPDVNVFDVRIGTYDQFEVYYSANPDKYMKTIYFEDDGTTPRHIEGNRICLDERMSFSVAMTGSSMLMNLYTKFLRNEIKEDFVHIMYGRDYIGKVTGYE